MRVIFDNLFTTNLLGSGSWKMNIKQLTEINQLVFGIFVKLILDFCLMFFLQEDSIGGAMKKLKQEINLESKLFQNYSDKRSLYLHKQDTIHIREKTT